MRRTNPAGTSPLLDHLVVEKKPLFANHHGMEPIKWISGLPQDNYLTDLKAVGDTPQVLFALPLLVRNECFGVLLVAENSQKYAFRAKRFEIIRDVASSWPWLPRGTPHPGDGR